MDTLDDLWEQNTKPIKMPNLCRNTNRFVAAGIFFELMGKRVNFYAREKSSWLCFFLLSAVEDGSRWTWARRISWDLQHYARTSRRHQLLTSLPSYFDKIYMISKKCNKVLWKLKLWTSISDFHLLGYKSRVCRKFQRRRVGRYLQISSWSWGSSWCSEQSNCG